MVFFDGSRPRLSRTCRSGSHGSPRIAEKLHFSGRKLFSRFFITRDDFIRTAGGDFVRLAGDGVLFVHHDGNVPGMGCSEDRRRDIAAKAHNDVRPEFIQDGTGFGNGAHEGNRGFHFVQEAALQAVGVQGRKVESGLRHDPGLHAVGVADEQNPGIGILFHGALCQCQGGIYVTAGSAGGNADSFHETVVPFICVVSDG